VEYRRIGDERDAENQDLLSRHKSVEEDLRTGVEALRQAQTELNRLENDKQALLDHVEELSRQNDALAKE
jgi:predicted nuclease with TOPRIM domain